ncbi:MAG: hypothetical protein F8N37_01620 [Telmatospirillum sp.]|nr:hypothetical protein [Telmatospirillum sp.]
MSTPQSHDDKDAIGRINSVLRGPVTELLQGAIPELRMARRRDAYERIMNDPVLVEQCFQEFRKDPDRFRAVLIGAETAMITSDDQVLSCGRSLTEVITLIVRAVAKRHFRARLGFFPKRPAGFGSSRKGLLTRISEFFSPPPPPPPRRKEYSRADALYQAMRASLLFEWQVGLIPHYVHIPLPLARELGPRLLEYRDPDQIKRLIRDGTTAAAPVPAAASFAVPKLKIDALWNFSLRFGLPALFGADDRAMRRLVETVQGPGAPVMATLAQSGLRPPEAAVTAICMVHRLGSDRFERLLDSDRAGAFLRDFSRAASERGIARMTSGDDIRKTVNAILAVVMPSVGRAGGL